jgi:hypothetical protein
MGCISQHGADRSGKPLARFDDAADCLAKLQTNFWVGLALFAGAVAGRVID